jgi:hypothetical protein
MVISSWHTTRRRARYNSVMSSQSASAPTRTTTPLGFESRQPYVDPVIEAYKKDVDRTLIRAMLDLTPEERILSLQRALDDAVDLREAMAAAVARGAR